MTTPSSVVNEFQVNTTFVDGNQGDSSIAALPDGGFVVAYSSWDSEIADTRIVLQEYDADGNAVGDQIIASSADYDGLEQNNPVVTVLSDGSWAVTWNTYGTAFPADNTNIQARIFNPDGSPATDVLVVSPVQSGNQYQQFISPTPDGGFIVTWRLDANASGSESNVMARLYDAAGDALGDDFQVNESSGVNAAGGGAVVLDDGSFLVGWLEYRGATASEPENRSSQARRYDADGTPLGSQFEIFTDSPETYIRGATIVDDGNIVLVGNAYNNGLWEITIQKYDTAGNPLNDTVRIADPMASLYEPEVSATPDGGYAIIYTQESTSISETNTLIQRYDRDGNAVDDPVQVNMVDGAGSFQDDSDLTTLEDGSLAVIWSGSSAGSDTDVYAEIFGPQWFGTNAKDKFTGFASDELFETFGGKDTIKANKGNDTVKAGKGNDSVSGQKGKDVLEGGKGNDTLNGGDGKDKLKGGPGDDVLTGGAGQDKFIFKKTSEGNDTITDFEQGVDDVDLKKFNIGFDDLALSKTDGGTSTVVKYADLSIVLEGVVKADVTADDFLF